MISNAAIGRIDVLGLVYTAAYVPDTNETIESVSIAEHAGSTTVQLDDANHAGGFTHCATPVREADRASSCGDRRLILAIGLLRPQCRAEEARVPPSPPDRVQSNVQPTD